MTPLKALMMKDEISLLHHRNLINVYNPTSVPLMSRVTSVLVGELDYGINNITM